MFGVGGGADEGDGGVSRDGGAGADDAGEPAFAGADVNDAGGATFAGPGADPDGGRSEADFRVSALAPVRGGAAEAARLPAPGPPADLASAQSRVRSTKSGAGTAWRSSTTSAPSTSACSAMESGTLSRRLEPVIVSWGTSNGSG